MLSLQLVFSNAFLLFVSFSVSTNTLLPNRLGRNVEFGKAAGQQLIFTDYIKQGKIEEARKDSLVTGITPNVTSYAGFFNVDEECGSNLFFYIFPSENDPTTDPVTIWLEGGPGASTFYSVLLEMGPYKLEVDESLSKREYYWSRNSTVIFVDSPVGTGFSYTGKDECYATEEDRVARDLLNALNQFFEIFPELKSNSFFIAGESYGGKYVPALGYAIHTSDSSINLKGLLIGDGWTDPVNQLQYSDYVYQIGLVDDNTRRTMAEHEEAARQYIANEQYYNATDEWTLVYSTILGNATGFNAFYNFLYENGAPEGDVTEWVTRDEVRDALHLGNATWHGSIYPVYEYLYADISRSVRPWLETLMENYRVVLYNGQLDIIVAYPLTMGYIMKLEWSGAEEYLSAPRTIWRVNGTIAGYAKTAAKFTEIVVRNAGHLVPEDQPQWAFDLYNRFIFNQSYSV